MSRMGAARVVLSGSVLAGLALGGCSLPDDREPRVIAAEDAPIDLDPADAVPDTGGSAEITLYFVDPEGALVSVERSADDDTLVVAIATLLGGPDDSDESSAELTTRIPQETELRAPPTVEDEVATIDLGCSSDATDLETCGLLGVGGTDQLILFGQLTCTANAVPGVSGVRFQHLGQPQQAQVDDGLTSEPVRCRDYSSLRP